VGSTIGEWFKKRNRDIEESFYIIVKNIKIKKVDFKRVLVILEALKKKKKACKKYIKFSKSINTNVHENDKNYSPAQYALLGHAKEYEYIMEALQDINNKKGEPYIINHGGIFILTDKKNLFADIVREYCKQYNKLDDFPPVSWKFFDNCMSDKYKTPFNLKNNKGTSKINEKVVNEVVKQIFEYKDKKQF
jgi:hypothetical protein